MPLLVINLTNVERSEPSLDEHWSLIHVESINNLDENLCICWRLVISKDVDYDCSILTYEFCKAVYTTPIALHIDLMEVCDALEWI